MHGRELEHRHTGGQVAKATGRAPHHLGEVLILADDLLDLAKRVDPRGITDALALAKNLRRQVITLNDIVDDLLKLRNQGCEYLEDAEEDGMLNYQLLEDL